MSECASDCFDTVDPRVQIELERLNTSTDDINKLEVDLDEARLIFRQLLFESTFKIQSLAKKLGGCIDKSRPYYEARFKANVALQELRTAAVHYEKANSAHSAAREMVYLAEQGLSRLCEQAGGAGGVPLDPAWQEMLNHATARVNQAEAERGAAGARHRHAAELHRHALNAARAMQAALKRQITKSRPYFEEKARYNALLDSQKTKVQTLEKEVSAAKLAYSQALRNLEMISDEIHRHRRSAKLPQSDATPVPKPKHQDTPKTNGQPTIEESPKESESPVLTNGINDKTPENLPSPATKNEHVSKSESIREWIKQNGAAKPLNDFSEDAMSTSGEYKKLSTEKLAVVRPKSLPQDFSDKYSDALTPFQQNAPTKLTLATTNKGSVSTPSTVGKNGPESDNWIEINLEYSSPEEISFEKCSNFSSLECYRQIPYERMAVDDVNPAESVSQQHSPMDDRKTKTVEFEKIPENKVPNSKVSADSPRRIIRNRLVAQKSLPANSLYYQNNPEVQNAGDAGDAAPGSQVPGLPVKPKTKSEIANWISRSSAKEDELQFSPTRRQSLDVLLNDTGEKMKEIFSQGFMMFHISSLTERRNSDSKLPVTEKLSPGKEGPECRPPSRIVRKMPSPLDKTLSYLNVCNDNGLSTANSDDQGSDTDSLASVEMLSEEQINSLMLDGHLEAACQQLLGAATHAKTEEVAP